MRVRGPDRARPRSRSSNPGPDPPAQPGLLLAALLGRSAHLLEAQDADNVAASWVSRSGRYLRLRELDREAAEVDDRTCRTQEVHAKNPANLEAIVHLTDLDIEVVKAVITNR